MNMLKMMMMVLMIEGEETQRMDMMAVTKIMAISPNMQPRPGPQPIDLPQQPHEMVIAMAASRLNMK